MTEVIPSQADVSPADKAAGFIPPREPIFDWGMRVAAAEDLYNDGSHPHVPEGALLVPKGTPGEVVRVGKSEVDSTPVYLVEFPGSVMVGCFEDELTPISRPLRLAPGVMG